MKKLIFNILQSRFTKIHKLLNTVYNIAPFNSFGWKFRKWCHDSFADCNCPTETGEFWSIRARFSKTYQGPEEVVLKFPKENIREALTLLGYDIELKKLVVGNLCSDFKGNRMIIDVGFNRGTFALLLLRHRTSDVFCFEPNGRAMSVGSKLVELNRPVDTRVSYTQKALGSENRKETLLFNPESDWLAVTGADDKDAREVKHRSDPGCPHINSDAWSSSETVECMKLDDHGFKHLPNHLLLKLDTEGRELDVLKGAVKLLRYYTSSHTRSAEILFESFPGSEFRKGIFELITEVSRSCSIQAVDTGKPLMSLSDFVNDESANFYVRF